MAQFTSHSEQDTLRFASCLASFLQKGDILVLSGDLGSGKTKFTQGILTFFGLENEISSPTFTIVNEYASPKLDIYHFDVYRLCSSDEFYAIGGEQYFENGLCIIEWGELIKDILPSDYLHISFSRDNQKETVRYLDITCHGNHYTNIIKELAKHENIKY